MPAAAVLKVLVVDDQNSVRQMTRMTLEQIGIRQIHEAENGKPAMDTAALQPLDLIISDYNMPEMDGLESAARGARPSGGAQGAVHPADRPRRPRARGQGGAGRRQQLSDQAVHRRYPAAEDRTGDGEIVLMEQPRSGGLATPVLENIRTFLSVMATELHETILRLERPRPG